MPFTATAPRYTLGACTFELLLDADRFLGLGAIWIGETQVRSGRLPLRPYTQSYAGAELTALRLREVQQTDGELRIRLSGEFSPLPVKLMRDHSFDPIHDTGDWDAPALLGTGELDLVLRPATDAFNGVACAGFAYHYEYASTTVPLFYLLDMASWELEGDITGATAYSQSSCSAPAVTFAPETAWSTEGELFFLTEAGNQNPIMTHNLPRWAGHGSFDFQCRGETTLLGIFERVELIRSVLRREAGKAELKTFDKHVFDQTLTYRTAAKAILLQRGARSETDRQNLWTWVSDTVDARARAEYGIADEPLVVSLHQNYWANFTVESYDQDLLPAAAGIGARRIFVDNLNKSAMTEEAPLPGVFNWNMCCGHEFEIAEKIGGVARVTAFAERCAAHDVQVMVWTNNDQALSSPINASERDDNGWFVLLEDARQKYGGAYAGVMSVLDFSVPEARAYFVESHLRNRAQTGISALFIDSFYNLGFMPVSYRNCAPRTMWRGCLQAVRELQAGGFHIEIESFGPFGKPTHGHPASYNLDTIFICYRVGMGNGYTTVPTNNPLVQQAGGLATDFFCLAHKAGLADGALFKDGQRIDARWSAAQRRTLAVYHATLPAMHTRYLQADGQAVLWHDATGTQATLWHFTDRSVTLPGTVRDLTDEVTLPTAASYALQAQHCYAVTEVAQLPVTIGA
jgi:hypothetical protein